jgi:hypothetical protein
MRIIFIALQIIRKNTAKLKMINQPDKCSKKAGEYAQGHSKLSLAGGSPQSA